MDYNRAIVAVMLRAINKRIVVLTNSDAMTGRLTVALVKWCKDRNLRYRDWFDATMYVPGYHKITIMHAAEFNMQRRRDFPGEVYTVGDGIITTLEKKPARIEELMEQVGA